MHWYNFIALEELVEFYSYLIRGLMNDEHKSSDWYVLCTQVNFAMEYRMEWIFDPESYGKCADTKSGKTDTKSGKYL